MKKLSALIIPFVFFSPAIRAQQPAAQSAAEILTWISAHFEHASASTVVTFSSDSVDMENENFKTSITFEGCRVSITQDETDYYNRADTGQEDYSMDQIGTATFDLSKALADGITVSKGSQGQPPAHLEIKFSQPFDWHQEQKYSPHPVPQDVKGTYAVSLIDIEFATPEMANQQAIAWHKAIVACGGKS
jgi:hypothetical protein